MNILGMGPMELLLIVVLALIVFGPAKLPEIMAQVGKAIADFRRATSELSDEFNRTIQSELQETRAVVDETKATFTDAKASVYDAHASVSSAITGTPAPVRTAVPGEALPAPHGTSTPPHSESAANGTAPAQSTPALADTTQWSWETSASTCGPRRGMRRQLHLPRPPPQARRILRPHPRRRPRSTPLATSWRHPTEHARDARRPNRFLGGPRPSHTISAHQKEWAVIEVFVESIRVNMTNYRRVVMLKGKTSPRYLPI